MKIISVNKYFYPKGGAESSFFSRNNALQEHGHKIIEFSMRHPKNVPSKYANYFVSEVNYSSKRLSDKLKNAINVLYSFEAGRKIEDLIIRERPDIANLHNIYHQLSPSIIHVLKKYKIPVILTLHDYKIVCASYAMFVKGRICEDCKNGKYYACIMNACAGNSRSRSLINTIEMYLHHKILNSYNLVDAFISPSKFLIEKVKEMGFKHKIYYLPNCIKASEIVPKFDWSESSIVYLGRLSKEKGIGTLVKAMRNFPAVTLKIIGEGPIEKNLKSQVVSLKLNNIKFLGYKSGEELKEEIRRAMFLVIPSEWYENNPRSVIESFALGKPAIGARIGGIPELVQDGITGSTYTMADTEDLCRKLDWFFTHKEKISEMGMNARKFVENELNLEKHYQGFMRIVEEVKRNYA